MADTTVDIWAVKPNSDEIYRGEISVSPGEQFLLSVRVCNASSRERFYEVGVDFGEYEHKGHLVSPNSCVRFDFPVSVDKSTTIKISVVYIDYETQEPFVVGDYYFKVNVENRPTVELSGILYAGGKAYEPGKEVVVNKGDYVVVRVGYNCNESVTLELVEQASGNVIGERSVKGSGAVEFKVTVQHSMSPLVRAVWNGDVVAVDGSWIVIAKSVTQPSQPSQPSQPTQPTQPTNPSQPSQPSQPPPISPVEALLGGLLISAVLILLMERR